MANRKNRCYGAFSLLELVIVVAIIAIIAAIGIPRMSRGTRGAGDSALSGNLAVLRNAIDLYRAEHGGSDPNESKIENQLTLYTDSAGATSEAKDTTHFYGPYIRKIPPLPVGDNKGNTGIAAAAGDGVGWIYTEADGEIKSNTGNETDDSGKKYSEY
jgi:prepilin-type N-terminal cleavage/methylation domain-containing protein